MKNTIVPILLAISAVILIISASVQLHEAEESVIEIDPVEQQKEICDSLYSEYIFDYTAYQKALINKEPDKLVSILRNQYKKDSLQLIIEMEKYFKLKNDYTR